MKIYAVYKGDKFLFEGTSKECAKYFNVKTRTIYWWAMPCTTKIAESKRKNGKERQRKIAVVIEED